MQNVEDELKKQIQQSQELNEALKKVLKGIDENTEKEIKKKISLNKRK